MAVLPPSGPPAITLPPQGADVPWPTAGWPTGSLPGEVEAGLDRLLDEAFGDHEPSHEPYGQSLAFVAVRGGRLVAERYGPTSGPDDRLISWSMAKSVTHALVGLLVGDGRLDIDRPADVPEWAGATGGAADPRSAVTVDQLLTMTSGLLFNEDYVDEATSHCIDMLFGTGQDDVGGYAAALPLEAEPGTRFNYSSGTTNILCRLLADHVGSGQAFEAWMRRRLLDPIGVDARLTFDGAGTWVGSSFLHATARDFAKFGLLYLRDGVWDGARILPEGWVDLARTARARDDEDGSCYGAHWWIWTDPSVFYAAGYETQRIIVDPAADLVLVRLGKTPAELGPNVDRWLEQVRRLLAGGPT